jgi:hypothetical protein
MLASSLMAAAVLEDQWLSRYCGSELIFQILREDFDTKAKPWDIIKKDLIP